MERIEESNQNLRVKAFWSLTPPYDIRNKFAFNKDVLSHPCPDWVTSQMTANDVYKDGDVKGNSPNWNQDSCQMIWISSKASIKIYICYFHKRYVTAVNVEL